MIPTWLILSFESNFKFINESDDLMLIMILFGCLENSQVANARFQAAAAIRDAAIREWGLLTSDDKRSLIR